ncbi:MAG: SDR family NAD(P)-dependent oxidoreductase [Candidatus Binatia bacterium]|nr:SDR family NAD(P)-dependent oxidoreductase [Candidatus Binatia bacterium]
MKAAILGATRGMGRALARELARRGHQLFLLGRNQRELERSARDLELHGAPPPVAHTECDLANTSTFEDVLAAADRALGGLDTVIVTAGIFAPQEELEADPNLTATLLQTNFTNTILFCEAARKHLLARGGGTLCVFSSVAGERGRKPVVLYGATKAGLSRYLEGLDHRYHSAGLRVVTVKPGFVRTSMTIGLKPPPFAGEADQVAKTVANAIERGRPVVYAPSIWAFIMAVIRCLPRFVMRKVNF